MSQSEISYPTYLELESLLALQRPQSKPEHPDELIFIVVHQASELWFKVILHEFDQLIARLPLLHTQLTSLQRALDGLIDDIRAGRKSFVPYRSLKVYGATTPPEASTAGSRRD